MRARSGFTLLELMLATVLTSIVVLLAYGAAQVSYDAQARLTASLRTLEEARALREVLHDALVNARAPQQLGDLLFTLHEGRLSFVTAGGGPPFDADYDWLLSVGPGASALELSAIALSRAPTAPVMMRARGVTRWDVRVRASGSQAWVEEWPPTTAMPELVSITLWRDSLQVGPPLLVRLAPGAGATPEGMIQE